MTDSANYHPSPGSVAEALIRAIHDSPTQAVVAVTGGGVATLTWLLTVPGASRTILEGTVPYAASALTGLLGAVPDQAVSAATAILYFAGHGIVGPVREQSRANPPAHISAAIARLTDQRLSEHMCRNIKTLFNFDPPATEQEIHDAALQFARKLSGFTAPSKQNEAAFNQAVDEVAAVARRLIDALLTNATPKNRGAEAAKARLRGAQRFGAPG